MADVTLRLSKEVAKRLRVLGERSPSQPTILALVEAAYLASLRTEEGRYLRGSLTFWNPARPERRPFRTRAYFPSFTRLAQPEPVSPERIAKLARAIDQWSGSIAVYGTNASDLEIWGVLDQMVQVNVRRHHESESGFTPPGIFTISIDAVGDLSVYHGDLFLGSMRGHQLVLNENEALRSASVAKLVLPSLQPMVPGLCKATEARDKLALRLLFERWCSIVARLCITLRRRGTGGSFLITKQPLLECLITGHGFRYDRLSQAFTLKVLDELHLGDVSERFVTASKQGDSISRELAWDLRWAQTDHDDREEELNGAVKLVASLATLDGLVLLDMNLRVLGFGSKIVCSEAFGTIYDGATVEHTGQLRPVDLSQLGTRHSSMLRYCSKDANAIGVVVSQDGQVRVAVGHEGRLLLWDSVKLLQYADYSADTALAERKERRQKAPKHSPVLGYTKMPKTVDALVAAASKP